MSPAFCACYEIALRSPNKSLTGTPANETGFDQVQLEAANVVRSILLDQGAPFEQVAPARTTLILQSSG